MKTMKQTVNDKIAMVFCPQWTNFPPIQLAYVKGSVKKRKVDCFDFNNELTVRLYDDAEKIYFSKFPDIRPFMFESVFFDEFETYIAKIGTTYKAYIEECVDRLKGYGIVGFSTNQENILFSSLIARILKKEYGILTIAGGVSMNMDGHVFTKYLIEDATFDIVVLGIAEDVLEELLDCLITGKAIEQISGLAFAGEDGKIKYTAEKISDLSEYSPPDYDDFISGKYNERSADVISLYTVLGCKGNCRFCTIHELHKGYRHKPMEHIFKEMLEMNKKYKTVKFDFSDSMFMGNLEDAMALFDFAIENNFKLSYQIRLLPYWNNEELVKKAAQCTYYFACGLETMSPKVRKEMGKMVDHECTMGIVELCIKHMPSYFNIIVGYPSETFEDFLYTYDFVNKYADNPNFHAGMNSFFIPNRFPGERYNIRMDRNGFWQSDEVNIYDRYMRVCAIRDIYIKHGKDPHQIYYHDSVEGILFDKKLELSIYEYKSANQYVNFYNAPFLKREKSQEFISAWHSFWSELMEGNRSVALFPGGKHTEWLLEWLEEWNFKNSLKCIIDDNSERGKKISGIDVLKPEELKVIPDTVVLSSDVNLDKLKERLKELGRTYGMKVICPYNFFRSNVNAKLSVSEMNVSMNIK